MKRIKVSLREQIMLVCLAIVLLLIWGSQLSDAYVENIESLKRAEQALNLQKVWIKNADAIEKKVKQSLMPLEDSTPYDESDLVSFIDETLRSQKLTTQLGIAKSTEGSAFKYHSLRVPLKKIPLKKLLYFEDSLFQKYPSIAIDSLAVTASRINPTLLDASLEIRSFELKQ